jgi:hypothetical protein
MTNDEALMVMALAADTHTNRLTRTAIETLHASLVRLAAIDRAAAVWEAARLGRVAWPNGDEYEALFDAEEGLREAIAGTGVPHG